MPTTVRRALWIPLTLRCWQAQTYDNRELIVVGPRPIASLLPNDERIRFIETDGLRLGAKRNLGLTHARGTIVAHWDDDDWYAPWRLQEQVGVLRAGGVAVSGLRTLPFFDLRTGDYWQYTYSAELPGAVGASLLYLRDLWHKHPFDDVDSGEDVLWCNAHRERPAMPARTFLIASTHVNNTSPRRYVPPSWRTLSHAEHTAIPDEATDWLIAARRLTTLSAA
jgi:glycosyltransferase involved in cell wall biosynthesis